jgi:hypothetical protein
MAEYRHDSEPVLKLPGVPPEPSDRDRIEWLLAFLRRDLDNLRPGERIDLLADVERHLVLAGEAQLWEPWWPDESPTRKDSAEHARTRKIDYALKTFREDLLGGITQLEQGETWEPFTRLAPVKNSAMFVGTPFGLPPVHWVLRRRRDGSIARVFTSGTTQSLLMASALDLLLRWWPDIRRCAHCRVLFLPSHGKQQYHDAKCAAAARWAKFAPTRVRTSRDYHKEYVAKVKRTKGPRVKVQRRGRQKARKAR